MTEHGRDRVRPRDAEREEQEDRPERDACPVVHDTTSKRASFGDRPDIVQRVLDGGQQRDSNAHEGNRPEGSQGSGVDPVDGFLDARERILTRVGGLVGGKIPQLGNRVVEKAVDRVEQHLGILVAEHAFRDREHDGQQRDERQEGGVGERSSSRRPAMRGEVSHRPGPERQRRAIDSGEQRTEFDQVLGHGRVGRHGSRWSPTGPLRSRAQAIVPSPGPAVVEAVGTVPDARLTPAEERDGGGPAGQTHARHFRATPKRTLNSKSNSCRSRSPLAAFRLRRVSPVC